MDLQTLIEEYLLTLPHNPNRHYDSEDYSEREQAEGELEAFTHWLHHTKNLRNLTTR